jgi:allantoinase
VIGKAPADAARARARRTRAGHRADRRHPLDPGYRMRVARNLVRAWRLDAAARLYVRARRAVLPEGDRPADARDRGRRDRPHDALDAQLHGARPGACDRRRRPGRPAGPGRSARPRERAGPHRVGGPRDRDPRGGRGGITTIVDMPLNSLPPTTSVDALRSSRRPRAAGAVDVAFWGGACRTTRTTSRRCAAGVCGFKAFHDRLGRAGVPPLSRDQLPAALATCAALGATLIVHAEAEGRSPPRRRTSGARTRAGSLRARRRPRSRRSRCWSTLAEGVPGARVHVVHLSAAERCRSSPGAARTGCR